MNYYVNHDGKQYGPFPLAQLQQMLGEGRIVLQDLAWAEGLPNWIPVSEVVGTVAPAPFPAFDHISPPNLHWALLLIFSLLTAGVFTMVWLFVQAAFARKIDSRSKATTYYTVGLLILFGAGVLGQIDPVLQSYASLIGFCGSVVLMIGHYNIKGSLEAYYNSTENIGLALSGVMTLFFNTVYFQYHLNRIADRKNQPR